MKIATYFFLSFYFTRNIEGRTILSYKVFENINSGYNASTNVPLNSKPSTPKRHVHANALGKDEVILSGEKSKDKQGQKDFSMKEGGLVAALGATIGLVVAWVKKRNIPKIKQLAEHIEFTKAETIKDAIAFGKKHLGIEKYSNFSDNDLNVINWINEGLVSACNKMRGKLKMPKLIHIGDELSDISNPLAAENKHGILLLNKKFFNDIDAAVNIAINNASDLLFSKNNKIPLYLNRQKALKLYERISQFKQGKLSTLGQKVMLLDDMLKLADEVGFMQTHPLEKIKAIIDMPQWSSIQKRLRDDIPEVDVLEKLSVDDQYMCLMKIMCQMKKNGVDVGANGVESSPFRCIYHELGHLQDIETRVMSKDGFKNPSEYPKELVDWLSNEEYMKTASKVSQYSCSGPAEFIAETYAQLISSHKLPDDVMALYKKMNGPIVPV